MGVYNAELFNNLGLCCFYAQQYDMTLTCFERALSLADEVTLADVWYNIGHVALVSYLEFLFEIQDQGLVVQSNIYITRSVKSSSTHKIKCAKFFFFFFLPKKRLELSHCKSSSHIFIGKSLEVSTN